jgi:hypothetical protein
MAAPVEVTAPQPSPEQFPPSEKQQPTTDAHARTAK